MIISACGCPSELICDFHDRVMAPFDKDTILFQGSKYALPILIIKGHSFSWHSEILLPHVRRILIYTVLVHQEGLRLLKFILDIRDRTRYSLRLFWSDWPSFVAHPQQFFLRW